MTTDQKITEECLIIYMLQNLSKSNTGSTSGVGLE